MVTKRPPSRWDLVLDQKPVPVLEHLLKEVARLFANELREWPPRFADGVTPAVVVAAPHRPHALLYRAAFTLARFELGRELEASTDFLRNQRWLSEGLSVKDKPMLLFLSAFMTEQLLAFAEATQGRVKRPRLITVVDDVERHFFEGLESSP